MASMSWKLRRIIETYLDDPEQLLIVTELSEAPKSAAQLAEMTEIPPARIRRHIRQLREEGLVESVRSETRRGAAEHFHLVVGGLAIDEEGLAELSLEQRRQLNGYILKLALTEATRALVTHPVDRNLERTDGTIARIPLWTDETGWKELAKLHLEFWERVEETRERIAKRLEDEDEQGFKVCSVILFFESATNS
jgi:DNA-binding MarR family transcriptional regulator